MVLTEHRDTHVDGRANYVLRQRPFLVQSYSFSFPTSLDIFLSVKIKKKISTYIKKNWVWILEQ